MITEQEESAGELLRIWRKIRKISQMDLALDCDTSSRHLSCIETGRANASRSLILRLSEKLAIPLRVRNTILIAADYSPIYQETGLTDPEMAMVNEVLDKIIKTHEPYPAMVLEPNFNIQRYNNAFRNFFSYFTKDPLLLNKEQLNLLDLIFHPHGMRDYLVDFQATYQVLSGRLHRLLRAGDKDGKTSAIIAKLRLYVPAEIYDTASNEYQENLPQLILPLRIRKDGNEVNIFTTSTTLGQPLNITLQELSIETSYPMDEVTEQFFQNLNKSSIGDSE